MGFFHQHRLPRASFPSTRSAALDPPCTSTYPKDPEKSLEDVGGVTVKAGWRSFVLGKGKVHETSCWWWFNDENHFRKKEGGKTPPKQSDKKVLLIQSHDILRGNPLNPPYICSVSFPPKKKVSFNDPCPLNLKTKGNYLKKWIWKRCSPRWLLLLLRAAFRLQEAPTLSFCIYDTTRLSQNPNDFQILLEKTGEKNCQTNHDKTWEPFSKSCAIDSKRFHHLEVQPFPKKVLEICCDPAF